MEKILADIQRDVKSVMGDSALLKSLDAKRFADEKFGVPTVVDILKELDKPGRDPRPAFVTASFKDGVEQISDLRADMILEGVVTNVAAFGAFVDIGVHQDGLVHISELENRRVDKVTDVVNEGDQVKVKVLAVDDRGKVRLSMKVVNQETGEDISDKKEDAEADA